MRGVILDPGKLPRQEQAQLKRSVRRLNEATSEQANGSFPPDEARVEINGLFEKLPACVTSMLVYTLNAMAEGKVVQVQSLPDELTTTQAAELLNVSRPFVVRLLDEGKLPHRMVGSHRRVMRRDVLSFRETMKRKSREAADELVKQAQELDLGY